MTRSIAIISFVLFCVHYTANAQNSLPDSNAADSVSDTTLTTLQFNNPHLQFKMIDSILVRFDAPMNKSRVPYYDPRNVIPENPMELDYRESSYYTPRMISDRMDQIMNRPRSDSFVPIPALAMLAASVALQMVHFDFSSDAGALDYLQDQDDLLILKALWKKSPQTVSGLLKTSGIDEKYTYKSLEQLLEEFSKLNLVKRKLIEAGPTQYFAAQSREEVILALKHAQESPEITDKEKTALLNITNFLNEE